jgi:hypothetical protein
MKKAILPIVLLLAGFSANAQNPTDEVMAFMDNLLITITVVLLMVLILVAVALLKMFDYVKKNDSSDEVDEVSIWERLLSLKPLSAEKDIELDHNYDDIKELNNPIPPWFNVLFYGTIVFGFAYILLFHVFQINPLQAEEYKTELLVAEKQKQEYLKKMDNLVNEDNVTLTEDPSKLAQGAEVFKTVKKLKEKMVQILPTPFGFTEEISKLFLKPSRTVLLPKGCQLGRITFLQLRFKVLRVMYCPCKEVTLPEEKRRKEWKFFPKRIPILLKKLLPNCIDRNPLVQQGD